MSSDRPPRLLVFAVEHFALQGREALLDLCQIPKAHAEFQDGLGCTQPG